MASGRSSTSPSNRMRVPSEPIARGAMQPTPRKPTLPDSVTSPVDLIPEATSPRARTTPADLERCATRLRTLTENEGLTADNVRQLLGPSSADECAALDFLFDERSTASRRAMRRVLERLEDRLGVALGATELTSSVTRVGRRIADLVGVVVGLASGYIVVGGLIEGDSLLLGDSVGPLGLLLFVGVLALLGLFEALHTSATQLKIADLGALAQRFPRAAALHRHFRTDHGLARFLAGRQMVVVFTVFICSPLSSFPGLAYWPLTDQPLPALLHPVVAIGLPGALFVLWFGQLVPQFLATRHAVRLTNARLVALAFRVAYALEAAGLARPGFWMTSWDHGTEKIPSSSARRWQESASELVGYGSVGVLREWTILTTCTELSAATTIRLFRDGATSITDGSLLVPGAPMRMTLDAHAIRPDDGRIGLAPSTHREETLPTGDRRFHKPLLSAVGGFRSGDTLHVTMDADYASDPARDLVHIDRPVRYVLFRVVPEHQPVVMGPATLRTYSVGDGLGDLTESRSPTRIEPRLGDGLPVLEHVIEFPPPDTLYVLEWQIDLG